MKSPKKKRPAEEGGETDASAYNDSIVPMPIRISWKNSDRFNSFWLAGGHRFTPLQRIGFVIFSLIAIIPGTVYVMAAWSEIIEKRWYFIAWLVPGIALLCIGIRGCRLPLYPWVRAGKSHIYVRSLIRGHALNSPAKKPRRRAL